MAEREQTTKVHVEEGVKFGTFANAFRVIDEVGPDCFLDFMIYSSDLQEATVVSRVRVRREFLPSIRTTLSTAMKELLPESSEESPEESFLDIPVRKSGTTLH